MVQTKNLGQLAAVVFSNTAPTNTQILWYDLNGTSPSDSLKIYNTSMNAWELLVRTVEIDNSTIKRNTQSRLFVDTTALYDQDLNTTNEVTFSRVHISNLTPVDSNEATTKDYVDNIARHIRHERAVADRLATPPASPSEGDRYIVIATATGAWAGQENNIAEFENSAWTFETPTEGVTVYVDDEDVFYQFNGTIWVTTPSTVNHNALNNLQGGTNGPPQQRFHLTENEHDLLTEGTNSNADSLHTHNYSSIQNTPDEYRQGSATIMNSTVVAFSTALTSTDFFVEVLQYSDSTGRIIQSGFTANTANTLTGFTFVPPTRYPSGTLIYRAFLNK